MGAHFENITYSSEISLTLVVDDIARRRREVNVVSMEPMDIDSWLNALQRQSAPLVHSSASREHLEAWLEEVEKQFDSQSDAPLAGLLTP